MMTIKIKLKSTRRQRNPRVKYNLDMLKDPTVLHKFQAKIGGRFAPLLLLEDPQELADAMTKELNEIAEDVLGRERKSRQIWVTDDTLRLCDSRRELKRQKFKNAKCAEDYRFANGNVRRELRMDKERWIENQCKVIESNLLKGNAREAYKTVKCLTKNH